jgi:hypothetical protein
VTAYTAASENGIEKMLIRFKIRGVVVTAMTVSIVKVNRCGNEKQHRLDKRTGNQFKKNKNKKNKKRP